MRPDSKPPWMFDRSSGVCVTFKVIVEYQTVCGLASRRSSFQPIGGLCSEPAKSLLRLCCFSNKHMLTEHTKRWYRQMWYAMY